MAKTSNQDKTTTGNDPHVELLHVIAQVLMGKALPHGALEQAHAASHEAVHGAPPISAEDAAAATASVAAARA